MVQRNVWWILWWVWGVEESFGALEVASLVESVTHSWGLVDSALWIFLLVEWWMEFWLCSLGNRNCFGVNNDMKIWVWSHGIDYLLMYLTTNPIDIQLSFILFEWFSNANIGLAFFFLLLLLFYDSFPLCIFSCSVFSLDLGVLREWIGFLLRDVPDKMGCYAAGWWCCV